MQYLITGLILVCFLFADGTFGAGIETTPAQLAQSVYKIEEQRLGPVYEKSFFFTVSKDRRHFAYGTTAGDKYFVVVDGQPGPAYDMIGDTPVFSPDSKCIVYVARKDNKWFVIVDGQPGPAYDGIGKGSAIFSPDSRHAAYIARKDNKWFVIVDGQPGPAYDGIGKGTPVFSPDSRRVAYVVKKDNKLFVIVDGQPGPAYDMIGDTPVFSPDSRHVEYIARKDNKWFVVVDDQPGPEYEKIITYYSFHDDGVLDYLAYKEKFFYRVRHIPVLQGRKTDSHIYREVIGTRPTFLLTASFIKNITVGEVVKLSSFSFET
ncbi:MAG: hypothetical protein NT096_04435 [Proteobacteria bacterium]|nr:hypothetical protein [Pseudomonadota bacterium]